MTKRKLDFTRLDEVIDQIQQKRKREQKRELELARLTKLLSETKLIPLEDFLAEEMKEEPILWFWHLFLHGFRSEFEKFEEEVGAE